MYKVEIFDTNMDYVSACYADDAQIIALDYLAFDPFQINVQLVGAKKGYFVHITDNNGEVVADCVISDVKPQDRLQDISLRPLQAVFDREVFYTPVSDAITWIASNLNEVYVSTTDVLQRLPLNVTYALGSRSFPLTGYNFNPTINILSVITNAFATWDVVTKAWLDLVNKEIRVHIFEQTATQTIECDLENIVSSEITLGDSYGSANKLTVKKTVEEGTPSGTTEITYYLHTDGTIDTTDTDRITPVFFDAETLEQTEDMTDADWIAETEVVAKETLTPAQYDNEVVLMVWGDDKIINPRDIDLGTITTLYIKGETYYSILTGVSVEGGMYTLTFGAVRTELTKKLSIEKRNGGSTRISGGGGGGAGGDSTSVLYFYNRTVSVASNAEILRIANAAINANTVVLECTFANPSAISGTVSWTSYNGYISFIGTCTVATTANVTLGGTEGGVTPPGTELFPVGSVVCESTNTNPSVYYGGTWELIDKQFKYKQWLTADVSDILTLESGTTVSTLCVSLREHCISIERMSVQSTSAISESTITLGTFKFASLGVVGGVMNTNKYFLGQSDGGNGIAFLAITTSGIFETLDRVTTTSGGTIAAGNNINFAFDIQLRPTEMLDSFCDQFYFKRTA